MKVVNKKAHFNYEVAEVIEVGINLSGAEAKSASLGQVSLDEAHVKLVGGEAWVVNMHIYPYKYADNDKYEPARSRKLLLHKKQLIALQSKMKQSRLVLIPTAMYSRGPRIKLEIGLARGKKMYEKREAIKKRDLEREEGVT